jgi:RNA-binding protein 5/10
VEEKEVDKEVDEFGRKNDAVPAGPRWPPPFDRRSATYVFDSRSGMFYHASSQFFFDPKTKLYYGNKEQKYYVYCRGEKPPFQEFKQEAVSPEDISQKAKVVGKKVIAISLKTKVLASSAKDDEEQKKEQAKARIALVSRTKKLHDTNIDRWSERVRELSGKEQVVRTKTGDPVCLLCKRKFSDLQKLDQHENLSELHKTNLSKYSKRRNINEEMAAAHYRDRAFERRILHGTDDIAAAPFVHSEDVPDSVVGPQETLGESNVGNKMLQKLGWKSGTNLGRNAGGESTGGSLKKDWERIEHLAKSGNRK